MLALVAISSLGSAQPAADAPAQQDSSPEAGANDASAAQTSPPDSSESQPPPVIAPVAVGPLAVEYPEGETEAATVIVELSIDVYGQVKAAKAVDGEPPFAAEAERAALGWRFTPARRAEQPVAARIRVQVDFEPPVFEEILVEAAEPPPESEAAPTDPDLPPVAEVEVVVLGERVVGVKKLGKAEVRQMPGAFGDPYRAIEALPGVTPMVSGLPYFFVRGAPPGNIGYFFDGVSVPLLFHVGAGPGVIHPAFIDSVDLYSGSYPIRFGRFAGGIVSGEAEEPDYRFRGEASIRLVDSGAFVEVPFADGRGSAMVAGRYSYTGLVISLLADDVNFGYWDYQTRIRYDLSNRDQLTVFAFGSHDYLSAANQAGQEQDLIDLTFHRVDTRYTRFLDKASKLDLTLSLGYDLTGLGGDPDQPEQEDLAALVSRSAGLRLDYERRLSPQLLFRAGTDTRFSRFEVDVNIPEDDGDEDDEGPGVFLADPARRVAPVPGFPDVVLDPFQVLQEDRGLDTFNARFLSRNDLLGGAWADAVYQIAPNVTLTPGLRVDMYNNGGELAFAVEPRIAARFDVSDSISLTHDLGIAHQPPSFPIPIPGLGGAAVDGLQRAIQSSAAVEAKLPLDMTASATVFQNVTLNSTDVFGVSDLVDSDSQTDAFSTRTTAHTYGLELYLMRSLSKRIGGFLSYTLSRSLRSVPRLSGVSSFDRTHVLNAALAFDLGANWRLGTRGVLYSGKPAEVAYRAAVNDPPRGPWFYRLDWRLEKRWTIGTEGAWWALVMEVLNTTLNKETTQTDCYAYGCWDNAIGPVTIPSIGVEASF